MFSLRGVRDYNDDSIRFEFAQVVILSAPRGLGFFCMSSVVASRSGVTSHQTDLRNLVFGQCVNMLHNVKLFVLLWFVLCFCNIFHPFKVPPMKHRRCK